MGQFSKVPCATFGLRCAQGLVCTCCFCVHGLSREGEPGYCELLSLSILVVKQFINASRISIIFKVLIVIPIFRNNISTFCWLSTSANVDCRTTDSYSKDEPSWSCQTRRESEAVFLNFKGAQESISRNKFRQAVQPGGPVRQPYSYSVPSPP
jgi:hypothetical protein